MISIPADSNGRRAGDLHAGRSWPIQNEVEALALDHGFSKISPTCVSKSSTGVE